MLIIGTVSLSAYSADNDVTEQIFNEYACTNKRITIHDKKKKRRHPCLGPYAAQFLGQTVQNVWELNKNLVSWDSFKVIATVFPFFIGARMMDEKLQNFFYKRWHHKNVNQMPQWCEEVAEVSLAIPIVFFGLQAFLSKDLEMRTTSQIFLIGMPFVIFGKKIIKKLRFDMCLRPWNQNFSCKQRSSGGFPSGHMAEITYMAMLYGMRFGPRYAIPLTIYAAAVGITFLNCNRHYISQLIAGAGFGALYAIAANKLINTRMAEHMQLHLEVTPSGGPALAFAAQF